MNEDLSAVVEAGRRGEALLREGHYAEGFRLYDQAWRKVARGEWLDLPLPRWQGEPLAGRTVLVSGEQGFGDQIMFARFARLLQAKGAEIVWLCRPPLARLLTEGMDFHAGGLEQIADGGPQPFYCPSGALPGLFFPPLAAPPGDAYLAAPSARPIAGARIGVVAQGDPQHAHDAVRSLPPALAAELLAIPGAVSLRPEDSGAVDFHDTAALVAGLDLVVTVDTSVAHLAGAMGKPVWVLLSEEWCDWRWMTKREDSPWYPSARLIRQRTPGDWREVVARVRRELG